nr:PREDICTED: zinc finger protein Rlf [Lepisosteus oculatus]
MADGEGGSRLDGRARPQDAGEHSLCAMDSLLDTLGGLEDELRGQGVSETSTAEYCNRFCQALMQYAGSRNSVEHGLPLLEVYRLSIQSFAAVRPLLSCDSDSVALVLKRLALSCFELLLSVPDNEIPYDSWLQFHHTVQVAHNTLVEFGNTDLQALLRITSEGGAWKNAVLVSLFTAQPVDPEQVSKYIALEGAAFLEMRIKHLLNAGEVAKAMILAKICLENEHISNKTSLREMYISQLCSMMPSEEAIKEISSVDGKEVLDIICNLEADGQENNAFILCTTYLTQQLQQENIYCSWELTLFWSKLQKRIDPSLDSFLDRCRQFGLIAKTVYHLLFLVKVIQTEAEQLGLAASIELCVRALQIPQQDDAETKTSVCKMVACLLPDDLEVLRGCQLTEFLLSRSQEAYDSLEELYLKPDQKYDEENSIISNSLRCELLLALKAHWPFDPEFWDWKTLKRHCLKLLGLEPSDVSEEEEEEEEEEGEDLSKQEQEEIECGSNAVTTDQRQETEDDQQLDQKQDRQPLKQVMKKKKEIGTSERYQRWLKYKFFCQICKREVIEARILHHSKMHLENGVFTCPVCLQKFQGKQEFMPHITEHIRMPARKNTHSQKKKKVKKKKVIKLEEDVDEEDMDDMEPGEIKLDPSLMMYYQSTADPDVLEQLLQQTKPSKPAEDDYITFSYIDTHFELQDRDVYPCPATDCTRNFKHFKYLSVHLKAEHAKDDDNIKHYLEMKDRREKCTFCRRHFFTAYHHRKHRRVHYGEQPYMCVAIGCGARFNTTNELVSHKQGHGYRLSYHCELKGCTLTFSDLGQLYHHEAQHFRDAAYSCVHPGCKKFYYSKKEFLKHLAVHGLTFTEEDFIAQRNMKRKPVDPFAELAAGNTAEDKTESANEGKSHLQEAVESIKKETESLPLSNTCTSTSQPSASKELTGTVTSVAVCFDGKRFTCGFEGCGRTYTLARDIQKHLKTVHPAQFKHEKKGQSLKKQSKEKSSKLKSIKQQGHQDQSARSHSSSQPIPTTSQKNSVPPSGDMDNSTSASPSSCIDDYLKDILLGFSQLSLNNTILPGSEVPCNSISGSSISQISSPPPSCASSPAKAVGKKVSSKPQADPCSVSKGQPPTQKSKAEASQSPSPSPQKDKHINQFLVQPTTKPFVCEVKGCSFRSVTSSALMVHYLKKHGFSKEKVKEMEIFKSSKFKPFRCHLCPRSFSKKSELRVHFISKHHLSENLVEQMSCSLKRRSESSKNLTANAPDPPDSGVYLKDTSRPEKKQCVKVQQNKGATDCTQKYQKNKQCTWLTEGKWEKGTKLEIKQEDKNKKVDVQSQSPLALQDNAEEEDEEEEVTREGRGSRRLVAKNNLCYILTKYHKPFHCVHKGCSSAFTNQNGLIRHLQSVHRYNRSQLCLEGDMQQGGGARKDLVKPRRFLCKHKGCGKHFHSSSGLARHYREFHRLNRETQDSTTPASEDPIPRFSCTYNDCTASYHLYSSLLRHLRHIHRDHGPQKTAPCQLRCSFEGCTRVFSQHSSYKQHVFYSHWDYYNSFVLRLQNDEKDKSASGCQKKLIIAGTQPLPRKTSPTPRLPLRQSLRNTSRSQDTPKEQTVKKESSSRRDRNLVFRTPEEALQMCQDRCFAVAYPCMLQDCDSVVTLEKSLRRHYVRCHRLSSTYVKLNYEKLVNNAEKLEELIQKKSALSTHSEVDRAPNGVLKVEYQAEPENHVGPKLPMSLHSIKTDPLDGQDPMGFGEESSENNLLVDADDLLYGEALKNGHSDRRERTLKNSHEEKPKLLATPPSSLRFTIDEGFLDYSGKGGGKGLGPLNNPSRQPLKRKNELEEPLPGPKDIQQSRLPHSPTSRTFDLTAYKPMGFESSFLKFIQESEDKEDEFEESGPWDSRHPEPQVVPRRRDLHRRSCSVKENSQSGLALARTRNCSLHGKLSAFKPRLSAGESATVKNLRSILDKALTDCGDLAIKQLHYLKPVVVLERSKFSTSLLDLFPTKKTDQLRLGSS